MPKMKQIKDRNKLTNENQSMRLSMNEQQRNQDYEKLIYFVSNFKKIHGEKQKLH